MEEPKSAGERASLDSFRYMPRWLIVILRLHVGVILLITVAGKIFRADPFSIEMVSYLEGVSRRNAPGFYQDFVQQIVLPHATLFSYLVMTGEVIAGLSLLLGLCTRIGAAIAMFLFLNYMFSKGNYFWSPNSEDAAVFFSGLVCCLGAAGRVFGIDAYLARRWPNSIFW
jgi:thiosulfate dehydrogenase [quinone] large subunit